jgi:ubiquinone/menaquinone biosynthesis C-methylase UbiE
MQITDNYKKHTSKNPIQKILIGNFLKTLAKEVKKLKVDSILDGGAGEGFTLEYLRKSGIGKSYEGIDFLQTAVEIGNKLHPEITLKKASIYELPYRENSFDLVISTEVLEHLRFPDKALQELVRVSKKYVLLSVPNEPIFMLSNLIRVKNVSRFGNDIEHINHWSFWGFEKFVKQNSGLKIQIISKKHPFPWTLLVLEK